MKANNKLSLACFFVLITHLAGAQDIFLAPYKQLSAQSSGKIGKLVFSADAKWLSVSDESGKVSIWSMEDEKYTKQFVVGKSKVVFQKFISNDQKFILLDEAGAVYQYSVPDFMLQQTGRMSGKVKSSNIDPSGQILTVLLADKNIELFDLTANMTYAKIPTADKLKNVLFVGYDRFGQQLSAISELGEVLTWNPTTQKFIRELKLQSGEYSGSKSALHAASTNTVGDRFVVGLQEVFIPKGGMQGRNQPERRNMIIAYDWQSGGEVKRLPIRFRVDEMAFGPGPGHVAFYSKDALDISVANLEKGEISNSVKLQEVANAMSISDNNEYLAVGTVKGTVNLFSIERNTPAGIQILNPSLDRSYGVQVHKSNTVTVKGQLEGTERFTKVVINDQEAELDFNGGFTAEVPLTPGKNKVRVLAQNSENKMVTKDFYLTSEPDMKQSTTNTPAKTGRRVALVIGNAQYQFGNKLINTVNDAEAMSTTLKALGFEVIKVTDGAYEEMKNAIYKFGDRIQDADVSLFYYAGHGLEVDGTNYLVPVDANIQTPLDIRQKALPLPGVLRTMEFANDEGLNMVILDACRNNPFPTGKRGGAGLAKVTAPSGTLIAYATDPGSVASDGDGKNGLYTGELIKQMKIQQRIEDVFMNTRNNVEELSKGSQRPWEEARLKGVFYLK